MGRPLIALSITAEDQAQLLAWRRRPKTAQALAMRSRVVLLAADGNSDMGIHRKWITVERNLDSWRIRIK